MELVRSPEEVVFLGFDCRIKRLVELHVLRSGTTLNSVAKRAAFDRAQQASQIRGAAFMRILDVGEDQGLVYYTTNLNDGEFVTDYMARRGALPPATVFSLVFQLLDELIHLKEHRCLVAHMRLDRVVVSTLEDTFLQLRIYDYGLSSNDSAEEYGGRRMVVQACELIFLMLTGKSSNGDNPDRYPALTALPMDLRTTIRTALTDPANAPTSIEKVREDVREAFGATVSSIQARNSRKHLVVTPAVQPRSQLQDLLLENVPVETILGNRFRAEDADHVRRYPFSIPCINVKNEQAVTVHLLPPSRIVDKAQYEAVPLQMWRFNAEKHPNILRSLSLWESPDWTFLTEEREPGFTLSRLMAERFCLNPAEVLVVLRQVRAGMDQALECGVQRVDLHPSNILLRVGKAGPLLNREYERLMQKRLDAWPNFLVKLRAHLTMRNLYEPLLVDKPEEGEHAEPHLADRDYRHRAYVALAAYLLTGQRQTTSEARFPESVSETLVGFVRETLDLARQVGAAPSPNEFLEQFEARMNGPAAPDLATRLRGTTVAIEAMESAGSVSDFDNEWTCSGTESADDDDQRGPVARALSTSHFKHRRKDGAGWPVWAAAATVIFGMFGWWQVSGSSTPDLTVAAATSAAKSKAKPVASKSSAAKDKAPETKPIVASHPSVPAPLLPPTMVRKSDQLIAEAAEASLQTPPVFADLQPSAKTKAAVPVEVAATFTPPPVIEAPPAKTEPVVAEAHLKPASPTVAPPTERGGGSAGVLPADWKAPVTAGTAISGNSAPTLEAMIPPSTAPPPSLPDTKTVASTEPVAAAPELNQPPPEGLKGANVPAAVGPAPEQGTEEVIVRKAIMPTAEEIARFKEVNTKKRIGKVPEINASTVLPNKRVSQR
ncbi:MAG: hypothetical protein U0984_04440 [Prosthecobacter sp.]|nr:hypothetical protein [Prosthecobacter sp.]